MKRTLHFLALALMLNACTREVSDDTSRRKQLAGTWRSVWGGGTVTYVTTVSTDGHYRRIALGSNGVRLSVPTEDALPESILERIETGTEQ